MVAFDESPEPGARHRPVALDGRLGDAQILRRLLHRQAGEETQLDDLRLPCILLGQAVESGIQRQVLLRALRGDQFMLALVQIDACQAIALLRMAAAGVIDT